jgi:hypothetical protein
VLLEEHRQVRLDVERRRRAHAREGQVVVADRCDARAAPKHGTDARESHASGGDRGDDGALSGEHERRDVEPLGGASSRADALDALGSSPVDKKRTRGAPYAAEATSGMATA